jgi:hypothetical protein
VVPDLFGLTLVILTLVVVVVHMADRILQQHFLLAVLAAVAVAVKGLALPPVP